MITFSVILNSDCITFNFDTEKISLFTVLLVSTKYRIYWNIQGNSKDDHVSITTLYSIHGWIAIEILINTAYQILTLIYGH